MKTLTQKDVNKPFETLIWTLLNTEDNLSNQIIGSDFVPLSVGVFCSINWIKGVIGMKQISRNAKTISFLGI